MNKTLVLFLLLFSCDSATGPDSHANNQGNSYPDPIGIYQTVNATSFINWKYFRFTKDSLLSVQPGNHDYHNSLEWDIAFQRNHIKTNSGTSGVGYSGVYVDSVNKWNGTIFNNLQTPHENLYYTPDTILNTFYDIITHTFSQGSSNPILETWAKIDTTNNYTMTISNNQFIIKSSNGNDYYKFWPINYYDENGSSGIISLIYDFLCTTDVCGVCGGNTLIIDDCLD